MKNIEDFSSAANTGLRLDVMESIEAADDPLLIAVCVPDEEAVAVAAIFAAMSNMSKAKTVAYFNSQLEKTDYASLLLSDIGEAPMPGRYILDLPYSFDDPGLADAVRMWPYHRNDR